MDTTKRILDLPIPAVSDDIRTVVARYQPALLSPAQAASGLPTIRHLILACAPLSVGDARSMFATAVRFLVDVGDPDLDVDRCLTDLEVSRWLFTKVREGMPRQTVGNHRLRLARFLRVKRGLPARLPAASGGRRAAVPLDEVDRRLLSASLAQHRREVIAAFVAAVGADRVGAGAVGGAVEPDDEGFVWVAGGERRRIVHEWWPLAADVVGVQVDSSAWAELRKAAALAGFRFDRHVARDTYVTCALLEPHCPVTLFRRYGLTRRMIDIVTPALPDPSSDAARTMLRG